MSFPLDEFLPYRLSLAAAAVNRRFTDLHQKRSGLTSAEWRVMAQLDNTDGPVSIRDINTQVNLDKSVVSRAVARLEQAGLLCKSGNDSDRRLIAVEMTGQGRNLMRRLSKVAEAFQSELRAELAKNSDQFEVGLERLINGVSNTK